jgi:hypothetical protein
MEVLYAGRRIAEIGKVSFNGSGNAILRTLPQTFGTLINPSLNQKRNISVNCDFFLQNHTKTQMEQIQYRMHELFSSCTLPNSDLTVNDNTYTNVSIQGNSFEPNTNKTFMRFTLTAEMDHQQPFFDSQIPNTSIRPGSFEYTFLDSSNNIKTTTFPILNNYEVGAGIGFTQTRKPRNIFEDGQTVDHTAGFHSIKLQCWISGCKVKDMESYIANALIGPLGRQGTLTLSGRTFEHAILNSVSSSEHVAGNMNYTMEFIATQC